MESSGILPHSFLTVCLLSFSVTYSERMNRAQFSSEIYSLLAACDMSEHRDPF